MATIDAPRAIRVKTATGWADLVIQGAPGTPGAPGYPSTTGQTGNVLTAVTSGAAPTWQPPAPSGSSITYRGDYNPATTYHDGDYVVGPDGVTYQCVKEGTVGVAPVPWSPVAPVSVPITAMREHGREEAYSPSFTGTSGQIWCNSAQTIPLRLNYTPPADCWWLINMGIAIVQKMDAAYHYMYGLAQLTPADVDGISAGQHLVTQHNQVNVYENRSVSRLFKLKGGTPYQLDGQYQGSGGTWNYYCGINHMWLEGTVFLR